MRRTTEEIPFVLDALTYCIGPCLPPGANPDDSDEQPHHQRQLAQLLTARLLVHCSPRKLARCQKAHRHEGREPARTPEVDERERSPRQLDRDGLPLADVPRSDEVCDRQEYPGSRETPIKVPRSNSQRSVRFRRHRRRASSATARHTRRRRSSLDRRNTPRQRRGAPHECRRRRHFASSARAVRTRGWLKRRTVAATSGLALQVEHETANPQMLRWRGRALVPHAGSYARK